MFMKFPRAMGGLRIVRPLLVDIGSRVRKHAMIKLGVIPRHDQGAGSSRTVTDGRPALRVLRELHLSLAFHPGQHFFLYKLGVRPRHCVVLEPSLTALRIPAPVAD